MVCIYTRGNPFTIGYIEAKDIAVPLNRIEKDEQMGRYLRALDNLVLTDYNARHPIP